MYTRDELQSAACDSHACPWIPVGIGIYRLYDPFAKGGGNTLHQIRTNHVT